MTKVLLIILKKQGKEQETEQYLKVEGTISILETDLINIKGSDKNVRSLCSIDNLWNHKCYKVELVILMM